MLIICSLKMRDCNRICVAQQFSHGKVKLATPRTLYLNCPVQRGTGKLVVIFWIDDNLHDVVRVTLKHLAARPLLVPVP